MKLSAAIVPPNTLPLEDVPPSTKPDTDCVVLPRLRVLEESTVIVPLPSALLRVALTLPPLAVKPPLKLPKPPSTKVPLPFFVSPAVPPLIAPPSVKLPAVTVMVLLEANVTEPLENVKLSGPAKVKSPFQDCGIANVSGAPLMFPKVTPEYISSPLFPSPVLLAS